MRGNPSISPPIEHSPPLTVLATVTTAGLGELAPGELARRMWNCDESAFATDHSF